MMARRHRRLRHWLAVCSLGVAVAVFGADAQAESFTYEGHTLKYAVPPGYCLMDRQRVIGDFAYSYVEKAVGADMEVIALYLNCDDLTAIVANRAVPPLHLGGIAVPKSGGVITIKDNETRRDEIDRVSAKYNSIDLAWINEQLKQRGQERGVTFPELTDMRLVSRDDTAAYATMLNAADDKHPAMISVSAMSLTNQLPFTNVIIAPASDPNVIQALLDSQRRYMTWLIAQNETEEQRHQQSQPTPSISFGDGSMLGFGSVLIGGLCLFGAVIVLLRLRRA